MPTVTTETIIHAPVETVYNVARDIERYPQFMEDVTSVKILEQTPERQVSTWVSHVKEFKRDIKWTEEDFWNEAERNCTFAQTEGDFSLYRGKWEFHAQGDSTTHAILTLEYDYNVPLIGNLIKGLLRKKMQTNIDAMIAAIETKSEMA
jgi:ribosome-associated toxin RatA of RatAB toxin-antitoxin module